MTDVLLIIGDLVVVRDVTPVTVLQPHLQVNAMEKLDNALVDLVQLDCDVNTVSTAIGITENTDVLVSF